MTYLTYTSNDNNHLSDRDRSSQQASSKKSNLRNSNMLMNQTNTSSFNQPRKGSVPTQNTVLQTNENSIYQQTKESVNSNLTKNTMNFGKNNNEQLQKINTDSNRMQTNLKARVTSTSPQKQMISSDKKVNLPSTSTTYKQNIKNSSLPTTKQRSVINKSKNDDIDIIPFGDDNTGRINFNKPKQS